MASTSQTTTSKVMESEIQDTFKNSPDTVSALKRLAAAVPNKLIRTIVATNLKLYAKILDKMMETLGIGLTDPAKLQEELGQAKHKVKLFGLLMAAVLKDPEIRELIKELALNLNNSALKPFLQAATITLEAAGPDIDEASRIFEGKIRSGVRRAGDAVTGGVEDVIGTMPYIGNAYNAGLFIANTAQLFQAVVDTYVELLLQTSLRTLRILKKMQVPGLDAIDQGVDYLITAQNSFNIVKNKLDSVNATLQGEAFDTSPGMTKESLVADLADAGEEGGTIPDEDKKPKEEV